MPRRAAGAWTIGQPQRSGMPTGRPGARNPVKLADNVALRTYVQDRLAGVVVTPKGTAIGGPRCLGKVVDTDLDRIGDGHRHGVRSRLLIAYGSTFPTMR
jgi:hypothetical protein